MVGLALLAGCSDEAPPDPAPSSPAVSETETAEASPTTALGPVTGTIEIRTQDTSHQEQLGLAKDGPPADGSVKAAATAVGAAVDAWLEAAQAGEPALSPIRGIWLESAEPATAEILQSGVTSPDLPVASAFYLLRIQLEPDPTLVSADVRVTRTDDTTVRLEMVFDVTGDRPTLHAVGAPEDLP